MLKRGCFVAALVVVLASAAHAGTVAVTGIGPRVGFSSGPDQIVFGGHVVIGDVAPQVTFDPNLEIGLGDHQQVIALNFDLHYHFDIAGSDWKPYAGAGIGIAFFEFDRQPPAKDESSTEAGGNLVIGAGVPTRSGNRFFGEMRFGLGDIPSLKVIAGWNFKM